MRKIRCLAIVGLIAALVLGGCGSVTFSDSGDDAETETSVQSDSTWAEPEDEGKTYPIYSLFDEDKANASTITVYENHTVSYTDQAGVVTKGFLLTDPYNEGTTMYDAIALVDPYSTATKYITGLMYQDDSANTVSLDEATRIVYDGPISNEWWETNCGDLLLVAESPSVEADTIYLFFRANSSFNTPSNTAYDYGDCFSYNTATGKMTQEVVWNGLMSDEAANYSELQYIQISRLIPVDEYEDTQSITEEQWDDSVVDIGSFEKVYAALGTKAATSNAPVEVTTTTFKAETNEYIMSLDHIPTLYDMRQSITVSSNCRATLVDENGKTWTGFYFKDYIDDDRATNYEASTFFEFTDGSSSFYVEDFQYVNEQPGGGFYEVSQSKAKGFLFDNATETIKSFGGSSNSHISVDMVFVGTAQSVSPNSIFILYEGGTAILYNARTEEFETVYWQAGNWQTQSGTENSVFDSANPGNITVYANEGTEEIYIESFD